MFLKVKRKYERQMNKRMLFSVNLSDFFYQLRKKFETRPIWEYHSMC